MVLPIGIDLGTTHCRVSVMRDERCSVLRFQAGPTDMPAVLHLNEAAVWSVGSDAQKFVVSDPGRCLHSVKRLLQPPDAELLAKPWAFQVRANGASASIVAGDVELDPIEVLIHLFLAIREAVEAATGVSRFVTAIAVPGCFNYRQRMMMRLAATIAGFDNPTLIPESTAAAMAYEWAREDEIVTRRERVVQPKRETPPRAYRAAGPYRTLIPEPSDGEALRVQERLIREARPPPVQNIAVYRLGGGSFDLSIFEVGNRVIQSVRCAGDPCLGGDDFTDAVVRSLLDDVRRKSGVDLSADRTALARLRHAAEVAKHDLSVRDSAKIQIPYLWQDRGSHHFERELKRTDFEALIAPLLQRTIELCENALSRSRSTDIDQVVLVGGSTRIPLVSQRLSEVFQQAPIRKGWVGDNAVATGAAIQAAILAGEFADFVALDVTAHAIGVEVAGGMEVMVPEFSSIPTRGKRTFRQTKPGAASAVLRVIERHSQDRDVVIGALDVPLPRPHFHDIEVTLEVGPHFIIEVSATLRADGSWQRQVLDAPHGFSADTIGHLRNVYARR